VKVNISADTERGEAQANFHGMSGGAQKLPSSSIPPKN